MIRRGLLIKEYWLNKILSREKIWEIRGTPTSVREEIALIQSGSSKIFGTCELIDIKGPLTVKELHRNRLKAGIPTNYKVDILPYKKTYAWIFSKKSIKRLETPIRYLQPQGAVIWVLLTKTVSKKLSS